MRILDALLPSRASRMSTLDDYAALVAQQLGVGGSFSYGGHQYPVGVNQTLPGTHTESIGENFTGYASGGLRGNGVIWSLELARVQVFSQAVPRYQRVQNAKPVELFGNQSLDILRKPWVGGTTGALLTQMILDHDLGGNSYTARNGNDLFRLRPDWVDIVLQEVVAGAGPVGARRAGYLYWPTGQRDGKPTALLPDEVAHFATMPDPLANFRGMSWITPVLRDIAGDQAYTGHKVRYVDNAATPNLIVSLKDVIDPDEFLEFVEAMDESHKGPNNAGKTLYLAGGADVTVAGSNMAELDFKAVQGAGETRLAAAAGVGAVIAQFSEGMQGSALNAGNYGAARRRFADMTVRHLWQEAFGALESILPPPGGSRLWYDESLIAFLQEDEKDAADIRYRDAQTLRNLLDAGYEPDAAVAYLQAGGDLSKLAGGHSGLFSVQLQKPGGPKSTDTPAPPAPDQEGDPDE